MAKLNRRDFIRTSTSAGLLTAGAVREAFPAVRQPNIIFILADDLGYGDLSCYGQKRFKTPNIDRLAAEGIRFTDHYAGSTVCAPSRCCLMTGYHTGHSWVRGNWETGPHGPGAGVELRPKDFTVAELLKQAGYRTGLFGKWGLGVEDTTGEPDKQGFDEWFGYLNQVHAHFYYPDFLWDNGKKRELKGNEQGGRKEYSHDLITQEALGFVRRNRNRPFFLYLALTIPHAELQVPEDSLAEFRGKFPEKPYVGDHYGSQATPHAAFAAMVTRMDRSIGRLMDCLKENGIDDNTVVLFSSDNGPHREGGADPEFFSSGGPFRGIKRDLYEGGIRVPMIVRWPGKVAPGRTTEHVSAFWDFLPTAAEMAGVRAPKEGDGISFLPELLGRNQRQHDYLYWEFHERPTTEQAIRKGTWKAVRHDPSGPVELYDLSADKGENHDLAAQNPEKSAEFEQLFKQARTDNPFWSLKTR